MDLLKLLQDRYSTRRFNTDKKVPQEYVNQILEAARVAPTAHNAQPFHLYVLEGESATNLLEKVTNYNYRTPLAIVLTVKREESWKRDDGYDGADIDAGIVGTHIMLEAHALGLGCCWIAALDATLTKELLHLPEGEEVVTIFEIGYKREDDRPSRLHTTRKSIEELVTEVEFPVDGQ